MKDYASKFPGLFAFLERFVQITAPFSKWLLLPMLIKETWESLDLYPSLTPAVGLFFALAFIVYQILFHLCVEEDFRAAAFAHLRR